LREDVTPNECLNAVPDYYGVNLADVTVLPTKKIKLCAVPNCKLCADDYTKCTGCKDTHWLAESLNSCHDTIPNYWGKTYPAPTPKTILPCAVTDCYKCEEKHTICDQCLLTTHWLSTTLNKCYISDLIPDTYGKIKPDPPILTLAPCAVDNCVKCAENKSICNGCADTHWLSVTLNACYDTDNIPDFWGKTNPTT
jgi:hypothetical protein